VTVGTPIINGNITGGNAVSGSSGPILQLSGATVHVENAADFVTYNNNILLNNSGNSFGRVQAATSGGNITPVSGVINYGSGEIMVTEDSTLKIGTILTAGNATLSSRFGSIIEDSVNDVNVTVNGTASVLALTATNGSVQLGGLNRTSGNTTGNFSTVNITAAGSAQIRSTGNLTLGPISANSLNVTANNIAQSAPLNIFGLSTFSTNLTPASGGPAPLTGSIALPNTANNFGPLSLTVISPTQSIAVSENATLNLRTVNMNTSSNGTFTVNSVNGDIIDTGLGGAKLGGGSGIVTLAALNGNITLDDPTSDVLSSAGVTFNAKNVTLSVLGTQGVTLALGALNVPSSASGNLTVSSALGNIGNAGPLSVGGQASFQTGTGSISIGSGGTTGNVGFGTLRFIGNQVSIAETGNMDILTGSTAFGPANLISGGSITIVDGGPGTVTFGNIINMSATGNITLSRMQSAGQLTVLATGTKNLSALSLSTDLNGRTPIFGGTGANVDPAP
jgi:hypothetical protein